MVKEEVYQHAGNRDVDPDWKRQPRNLSVLGNPLPQCPDESNWDEDRQGSRENGMGNQDGEIDGSDCPNTFKPHTSNLKVVDEIRCEECDGGRHGSYHALHVCGPVLLSDEEIARYQKNSADRIENRVQKRQVGVGEGHDCCQKPKSRSRTIVPRSTGR